MKRIIGIILVIVAAATGVWNFNQTQNEVELSDLALSNIQALAHEEGVAIVCGSKQGACWIKDPWGMPYNCGEYTMVYPCKFSGYMSDYCASPC